MGAHLYTAVPDAKGHQGERDFVELLVGLGDERSHAWANVDYLPGGVPDIDLIFVHEEIGCFNIEVKAVSLEMIQDFGLKVCRIRDRSRDQHPVDQAGVAQLGLRNYLGAAKPSVRCPFFYATAAFPKVRREHMVDRFGSEPVRMQAEGMLFAEDLESSARLWQRLLAIRESPPRGGYCRNPIPTKSQITALIEMLDPGSKPEASDADVVRGQILSRQVGTPGHKAVPSNVTKKYLEPGTRMPVIFRGAPGTGKTVRLQEIAVAHARAGRAVLVTCYNKVLASTLRGIMATQRLGEDVDRRIVVTHVDELRRQLTEEEMDPFKGLFGTVCVDEAQDMSDDSFEFIRQLASDGAEWFMADGAGQELYGTSSSFLVRARTQGTTETLRRNYRNSTAGFLVAQATFEHAPDLGTIPDWVSTHPMQTYAEEPATLALELPVMSRIGELPRIVRVSVPRGQGWRQAKLHGYVAVFRQELEALAAAGTPRDLAIISARSDNKSAEPGLAREALEILGVPVHDQIDAGGRGLAVPRDHVRLASIHSSRGIEASRVVILDLERGLSTAPEHRQNSRIMAYIALSRAQVATTIVTLDDAANPFVQFVEYLVRAYREQSTSG